MTTMKLLQQKIIVGAVCDALKAAKKDVGPATSVFRMSEIQAVAEIREFLVKKAWHQLHQPSVYALQALLDERKLLERRA